MSSQITLWRLTPTPSNKHYKFVPDFSQKIANDLARLNMDKEIKTDNSFKPLSSDSNSIYLNSLRSTKSPTLGLSKSVESIPAQQSQVLQPLKKDTSLYEELFDFEKSDWLTSADFKNWKSDLPFKKFQVNSDRSPIVRIKKMKDDVEFTREIALRYLKPPTPPQPGEVIITQKPNILTKPAPPLIIRQQPPRPSSPAPLVIREEPPNPPKQVGVKHITIAGKRIPPAPRKVVIERLPQIPSRPQDVIVERWLPYPNIKRRVILRKSNQLDTVIPKPKNVIIQWQNPNVKVQTDYRHIGVLKANPKEYVNKFGKNLIPSDMLPEFVHRIPPPAGVKFAYNNSPEYELVGDIDALKLVDLDKEGLSEYKFFLNRSKSISDFAAMENSMAKNVFGKMDLNKDGRVTREEAEKVLLKINSQFGRGYGEKDVDQFMAFIDANNDGAIDFEEFKNAYFNLLD